MIKRLEIVQPMQECLSKTRWREMKPDGPPHFFVDGHEVTRGEWEEELKRIRQQATEIPNGVAGTSYDTAALKVSERRKHHRHNED